METKRDKTGRKYVSKNIGVTLPIICSINISNAFIKRNEEGIKTSD